MKANGKRPSAAIGESAPGQIDPEAWNRLEDGRFFVSRAQREELVFLMSDRFPSVMTERVADAGEVLESVIHREGGAPRADGEWPTGRELFALGEAWWYTEDERFAAGIKMMMRRWGAADEAGAIPPAELRERAARLLGWLTTAACIVSWRGFDETVTPSLCRGLERELRAIDGALANPALTVRDRVAGLSALAIAGMTVPDHCAGDGRVERSLGELALDAKRYLGLEQDDVPAILDGIECYLPLLILSLRQGLEVPGAVLQEMDAALDVLSGPPFPGPARARIGSGMSGVSLLPMIPAGPARRLCLLQGTAHVLGREDLIDELEEASAGLLFLSGPEVAAHSMELVPIGVS